MKYLNLIILIVLFGCSGEEKQKQIKTEEAVAQKNDKENIQIMNEIIKDDTINCKYLYPKFYVVESHFIMDESIELSEEEKLAISIQNEGVDELFKFKNNDIVFFDKPSQKIINSEFIDLKTDSFNKNILSFSRPYFIRENEVVVFFNETNLKKSGEEVGPLYGRIYAKRYSKSNGKWVLVKEYSLADIT